jgi:hypothetical protein
VISGLIGRLCFLNITLEGVRWHSHAISGDVTRRLSEGYLQFYSICTWIPTPCIFYGVFHVDTWYNNIVVFDIYYILRFSENTTGMTHLKTSRFMTVSRQILRIMRHAPDKSCRENQNTHFMSSNCSRTFLVYLFVRFACVSYGRFMVTRSTFNLSTYVEEPLVIVRRGCVQREI